MVDCGQPYAQEVRPRAKETALWELKKADNLVCHSSPIWEMEGECLQMCPQVVRNVKKKQDLKTKYLEISSSWSPVSICACLGKINPGNAIPPQFRISFSRTRSHCWFFLAPKPTAGHCWNSSHWVILFSAVGVTWVGLLRLQVRMGIGTPESVISFCWLLALFHGAGEDPFNLQMQGNPVGHHA